MAENTNPSLKITDTTGTHRLLKTKDSTLDLDVQWKNIDRSYTVSANIQKKTSQGYEGVLLQAAVSQGKNKFSLGGITGSGSYRLVITVTKDQRTVMEVPYYFIVQSVQSDNLYHTKEARFNVYFECLHWIEASFL